MEWYMYRYPNVSAAQLRRHKTTATAAVNADLGGFLTTATSTTTTTTTGPSAPLQGHLSAPPPLVSMEAARGSTSSSSTHSTGESTASLQTPFVIRHGRRYLRDLPYPLPCDLPELQRQNLYTLLQTTIFGKALCSPQIKEKPPKRVLEVGCGSGYWSSLCHDYLASLGIHDVEFVGLDIVPVAADLRKQGINWRFVQHDLRKTPLPFEDGEFDIVMCKDLGLVIPVGLPSQRSLEEFMRITAIGGKLELWDCDYGIRSLLPHPPPPPGQNAEDDVVAAETATFLISPSTPFANAQNKYLGEATTWLHDAIDNRKLYAMPCSRILQLLLQEPETLSDVGYRRIAVPLGEMRWEREVDRGLGSLQRRDSELTTTTTTTNRTSSGEESVLTEDQAALRRTALTVVIQFVEGLEPLLKEVSGKNQEEWQRWWGWMMDDLVQNRGASSGECLEMGAWWATRI